MGQIGIRIINVLLFSMSCFFTAGVFNHIAENKLAPSYAGDLQHVADRESINPTWNERKQILDRNLFGAKVAVVNKPPPSTKAPAPPPPQDVTETKLPLTLVGTMAGEPASLSSAVIMNTRKKKHMVLQVGDFLEFNADVTVLSIFPRRVLLQNKDRTEELVLEKSQTAPSSPGTSSSKRKSRLSRASRGRPQRNESPSLPDIAALEAIRAAEADGSMNKIASNLMNDLEPAYDEDGRISGVRAVSISEDGLLARAGVTEDDVIQSVNGVMIDSASSAARVLHNMTQCQPMTGNIVGPGGERKIEITSAMLEDFDCSG